MKNKYPGTCYICGKHVGKGEGNFERNGRGGWQVRHSYCYIEKITKTEG